MMIPVVVAVSPICAQWIGITNVNRSQPIESRPLTMRTLRSFRSRTRSITLWPAGRCFGVAWRTRSPRRQKETASATAANAAMIAKAFTSPTQSMENPATSGPSDPEVENPSDSHEKFAARSSGLPYSPTRLLEIMWASMKPEPISVAATNSVGRPGKMKGRITPANSMPLPHSSGRRGPMRSMRRPAETDSSIGSSA